MMSLMRGGVHGGVGQDFQEHRCSQGLGVTGSFPGEATPQLRLEGGIKDGGRSRGRKEWFRDM